MSITSVLHCLNIVAVLATGLLAGGAFYISVSMNPVLPEFGLGEHLRFFPYMYKRSVITQPTLTAIAVIGFDTMIYEVSQH